MAFTREIVVSMDTECQRNKIGLVFSQPAGSRSPAWRDPVKEFHSEFKTKEASLSTKQILFYYVQSKIYIGKRSGEGGSSPYYPNLADGQ